MKTSVFVLMTFGFGLGFVGCGYIDGPCWHRSEDGAGVGGGPIIPGGVGGYGDVSLEPQNAGPDEDMPVACWTERCEDGCDRQREEDFNRCQRVPAEEQDSCRQHAKEKAAACHKSCGRRECEAECEKTYEREYDECGKLPKGERRACREQAAKRLAACFVECEKNYPPYAK